METVSIEQVKRRNADAGYYFFEPATMRFFASRVAQVAYIAEDGSAYFVTSERFIPLSGPSSDYPRMYTVRCMGKSGDVHAVETFQRYASRSGADAAARRAASKRHAGAGMVP
jgi:hypothetical protein